jgi:glutathione S-transferase
MSLSLYCHPLASFCWKVLIALYENDTPFEKIIVDLGDPASRAAFARVWPLAKFPVLKDAARDVIVPESSIIIEYLAQHYPGKATLLSPDADVARRTRLCDRFYDLYVHEPMQEIVVDRLRPPGKSDPYGVEQARTTLATAYSMIDSDMADKEWAMGDAFTMADCAATPSLYYANLQHPLGAGHANARAYLARLLARASVVRVLQEAQPYMHMVPK